MGSKGTEVEQKPGIFALALGQPYAWIFSLLDYQFLVKTFRYPTSSSSDSSHVSPYPFLNSGPLL